MNKKLLEKLNSIISKYEKKESAILEILHAIQKENNYISEENIDYISKLLDIPYSRLKGVLTFYTMFNNKKIGKYHIQICNNISCHMNGAEKIKKYLEKKLSISENGISNDGLWSISEVECLGSCGTAPVIMINETYYENIDEDKLDKIISDILGKEEKKK